MNIELIRHEDRITRIVVIREAGDPKFYGDKNAAGESKFLYHLNAKLYSLGFDLVKKRMWKDGHLVDDMQQYLRSRKPKADDKNNLMIYNGHWAINGLNDDFNKGRAVLMVEPCISVN